MGFFAVKNSNGEVPSQNLDIFDFFTKEKHTTDFSGEFIHKHVTCANSKTVFTKRIELTLIQTRNLYEIEFYASSIASLKCL